MKINQRRFQEVYSKDLLTVAAVACGDFCTHSLLEDGTLYSWGGSLNSQLARRISRTERLPTETEIVSPLKGIKVQQVSCGAFHSLALDVHG
jgi:alpha-tubulin suppressor-like RCC1 family protein